MVSYRALCFLSRQILILISPRFCSRIFLKAYQLNPFLCMSTNFHHLLQNGSN
ncbi:hypothetical protein BDZ97DRAFT_1804462 [Flammula alnicola]|nr:hypothetical protein BDZ97DRAFT_1804462 [Flammula alnicola]